MGIFRGIGRGAKAMVNVPKWMGAKQLTQDANYVASLAKSVFRVPKPKREESFADALVRLNLTEDIIKQRYIEFNRLFYIYSFLVSLLMAYTIYLFCILSFLAAFLMVIVSGIVLTLVFRYHFWMFQIKQRKLGCSIREWFWVGVVGRKS